MNNRVKVRVLSILLVLSGVFAGASDFYAMRGAVRSRRGELARVTVVRNTRVHVEYDGVKRTCEQAFPGVTSEDYYVVSKVLRKTGASGLYDLWCNIIGMDDLKFIDQVASFFDESERDLCINAKALYYAISCGAENAVESLLNMGVDPNARDEDGMTPIMHMLKDCESVDPEQGRIIDCLIRHGASINARDSDGNTVLHKAAYKRNKKMYDQLVEYGADKTVVNNNGQTPLNVFRQQEEIFYRGYIGSIHQDGVPDLINVILHGETGGLPVTMGAIKYLLDSGADVNVADESGMTPLMHAIVYYAERGSVYYTECGSVCYTECETQRHDIIELLVSRGAQINKCDNLGNTALHYVALTMNKSTAIERRNRKFEIYRYLCRSGGNADLENSKRETPQDILTNAQNPKKSAPQDTGLIRLFSRRDENDDDGILNTGFYTC